MFSLACKHAIPFRKEMSDNYAQTIDAVANTRQRLFGGRYGVMLSDADGIKQTSDGGKTWQPFSGGGGGDDETARSMASSAGSVAAVASTNASQALSSTETNSLSIGVLSNHFLQEVETRSLADDSLAAGQSILSESASSGYVLAKSGTGADQVNIWSHVAAGGTEDDTARSMASSAGSVATEASDNASQALSSTAVNSSAISSLSSVSLDHSSSLSQIASQESAFASLLNTTNASEGDVFTVSLDGTSKIPVWQAPAGDSEARSLAESAGSVATDASNAASNALSSTATNSTNISTLSSNVSDNASNITSVSTVASTAGSTAGSIAGSLDSEASSGYILTKQTDGTYAWQAGTGATDETARSMATSVASDLATETANRSSAISSVDVWKSGLSSSLSSIDTSLSGMNIQLQSVAGSLDTGQTSGYYLQTDGNGGYGWAAVAGGGSDARVVATSTQAGVSDSASDIAFTGTVGGAAGAYTGTILLSNASGSMTITGSVTDDYNLDSMSSSISDNSLSIYNVSLSASMASMSASSVASQLDSAASSGYVLTKVDGASSYIWSAAPAGKDSRLSVTTSDITIADTSLGTSGYSMHVSAGTTQTTIDVGKAGSPMTIRGINQGVYDLDVISSTASAASSDASVASYSVSSMASYLDYAASDGYVLTKSAGSNVWSSVGGGGSDSRVVTSSTSVGVSSGSYNYLTARSSSMGTTSMIAIGARITTSSGITIAGKGGSNYNLERNTFSDSSYGGSSLVNEYIRNNSLSSSAVVRYTMGKSYNMDSLAVSDTGYALQATFQNSYGSSFNLLGSSTYTYDLRSMSSSISNASYSASAAYNMATSMAGYLDSAASTGYVLTKDGSGSNTWLPTSGLALTASGAVSDGQSNYARRLQLGSAYAQLDGSSMAVSMGTPNSIGLTFVYDQGSDSAAGNIVITNSAGYGLTDINYIRPSSAAKLVTIFDPTGSNIIQQSQAVTTVQANCEHLTQFGANSAYLSANARTTSATIGLYAGSHGVRTTTSGTAAFQYTSDGVTWNDFTGGIAQTSGAITGGTSVAVTGSIYKQGALLFIDAAFTNNGTTATANLGTLPTGFRPGGTTFLGAYNVDSPTTAISTTIQSNGTMRLNGISMNSGDQYKLTGLIGLQAN